MEFTKSGYNKLFEQWLQEWKDDAANKNSKIQYSYANALKSLRKYPLPIFSGHGCQHVAFFGDFTCKKLEKKLVTYLKENNLTRVTGPDPLTLATSGDIAQAVGKAQKLQSSPRKQLISTTLTGENRSPKPKKVRKPVTKKNDHSSSSDCPDTLDLQDSLSALRVFPPKATARSSRPGVSLSDSNLCLLSTSSGIGSSASVVVCGSSSSSNVKTSSSSIGQGGSSSRLNFSSQRPAAVLTIGGGGGFVARTASSSSTIEAGKISKTQSLASKFSNIAFDEFSLHPGTFDVVLCVDNQEINGKGNTRTKMDILSELQKQSINFEVRNLKAGDFLWIAKEKIQSAVGRQCRELVLDFIAERKRGDDLAISMKDGRYTCQKFRMKSSTLKRIIYIIEDISRFSEKGLTDQALYQAMTNMAVQDGFMVKETANLRETGQYLQMMTQYLQRLYSQKTLRSCSYVKRCEAKSEINFSLPTQNLLSFNTFSIVTKTNQVRTVSQAFLLELLALDGVSPAKASAIVQTYPTLTRLLAAYDNCSSEQEKQVLLRDIRFGTGLSTIGPSISKKLCRFYCTVGSFV